MCEYRKVGLQIVGFCIVKYGNHYFGGNKSLSIHQKRNFTAIPNIISKIHCIIGLALTYLSFFFQLRLKVKDNLWEEVFQLGDRCTGTQLDFKIFSYIVIIFSQPSEEDFFKKYFPNRFKIFHKYPLQFSRLTTLIVC